MVRTGNRYAFEILRYLSAVPYLAGEKTAKLTGQRVGVFVVIQIFHQYAYKAIGIEVDGSFQVVGFDRQAGCLCAEHFSR